MRFQSAAHVRRAKPEQNCFTFIFMSLKNIASNQVFRIQRVFEISKEIIADSYFKQVQVPLFRIVSGAISSELALPFLPSTVILYLRIKYFQPVFLALYC